MKKHKLIIKLFMLILFVLLSYSRVSYAANSDVIAKISNAFKTIKIWLFSIATPAAAVSIGSGLLIKKFSFGDEEKITMGKRLIRSTLFSYAFILLIDPVISAIQSLFG